MRRLTRRQLLKSTALVGIGSAAAGLLGGCGGAAPSPVGQAAQPAEGVQEAAAKAEDKFSLEVLVDWSEDYSKYAVDVVEPQLRESYPGVTINYVPLDWGKLEEKLMTAAAAGALPDVFRMGAGAWVIVAAKMALAIDDRVAGWGRKDDFYEGAWQGVIWEGKSWGVPQLTGPRHYAYRKDIADEEGVTIPDDWDWDTYMDVAIRLTEFEGDKVVRKGSSTGRDMQEFYLMLYSWGGVLTKDGQAAFAGDEGIAALTWMVERNNAIAPQGYSPLESSEIPYFALGKEVIAYGHPGVHARNVERYAPDKAEFAVVPDPPLQAKRVGMVNTDWLALGKTSKYPDAAWELLTLHCSPDALIAYNQDIGLLPPSREAVAKAEYIQKSPAMTAVAEHLDLYGVPFPVYPEYTRLNNIVQPALEAADLKQKTPEQALSEAAAEWNQILKANNWQD